MSSPITSEPMEIIVMIKSVYGNQTIYPICPKAMLFAKISGNRTLTLPTIHSIKALGYTVKIQSEYGGAF